MRLVFLSILFFLNITTSLDIPFGIAGEAGEAGEGAAGAAGKGASGEDTAGESGTNVGESGNDKTTGCTTYSCPNDDNNGGRGAKNPAVIPGSSTNGATDTADEDVHAASELIDHINDIIDDISSILSLAISTSDSTTYTFTRPTASPLPTAAFPCLRAQSIYSACGRDSVGNFTAMSVSQQASCLCYQRFGGGGSSRGGDSATTTWVPGLFDGYVSSCNEFVATQTVVTTVSASATLTGAGSGTSTGICESVGDVRASPGSMNQAATPAASSTMMTSETDSSTGTAGPTTAPSTGMAVRDGQRGNSMMMLLGLGVMVGLA